MNNRVRISVEAKGFSVPKIFSLALGPFQPFILLLLDAVSAEVKPSERGALHSPPSTSEVNNDWSHTSNPSHDFMA